MTYSLKNKCHTILSKTLLKRVTSHLARSDLFWLFRLDFFQQRWHKAMSSRFTGDLPRSIWTHASIYFSLQCAHPAWGLITFAQFRCPPLSAFETPPWHIGKEESMSPCEDSEVFNCDLLVSVMNTQRSQKVEKYTTRKYIYTYLKVNLHDCLFVWLWRKHTHAHLRSHM